MLGTDHGPAEVDASAGTSAGAFGALSAVEEAADHELAPDDDEPDTEEVAV